MSAIIVRHLFIMRSFPLCFILSNEQLKNPVEVFDNDEIVLKSRANYICRTSIGFISVFWIATLTIVWLTFFGFWNAGFMKDLGSKRIE